MGLIKHAFRQRQACAAEAGRSGIDDDVKRPGGQIIDAIHADRRIKQPRQLSRLGQATRRHGDPCRTLPKQRTEHTTRGAASTQQQHAPAADADAQAFDITHQTDAIGIVAVHHIPIKSQGIDGARLRCPQAQFSGHAMRLKLERHRHVGTTATAGNKLAHRLAKAIERRLQGFIAQGLAGLARERGMDQRRLAVRHRIANDSITVGCSSGGSGGGHGHGHFRASKPSPRVKLKRVTISNTS